MALSFLKKDDSPLEKKLRHIESQSSLIENHIRQLERSVRKKNATAPSMPGSAVKTVSDAPARTVQSDAVRAPVSVHTPAGRKLGKYLVTGSFKPAAERELSDHVRRNRRIFFIVLGLILLLILLWLVL